MVSDFVIQDWATWYAEMESQIVIFFPRLFPATVSVHTAVPVNRQVYDGSASCIPVALE